MNHASIIIATHQHAEYLSRAIDSALAQTLPCEVIVIDDGSTDDTFGILARHSARIVSLYQAHRGVAHARNRGMELATAPFVCFLDADDVIAPNKIELQVAALKQFPLADWCLCDVRIVDDISRQDQLASERYGYADMGMPSDLSGLLAKGNFIPVHSPLIRRTALDGVRFPAGKLEDWQFWQLLSARAPARYIPDILATYYKKRTGRNQTKC